MWGTGKVRREFLHVDDAADACLFLMNLKDKTYDSLVNQDFPFINIGFGKDISILELAGLIREIVGFTGDIICDPSKPDGTPRKLLDVPRLAALGWQPKISLQEGIRKTNDWCRKSSVF